jgi:FeS assembly SUF system regulator
MIRLSRLADYAVLLMSRMATAPDAVHNALDIAQATGVPTPTVSKLLATLTRAGLLTSARGAKGGYTLAQPARAITVAKIIAAIDGPIAITSCLEHPGSCGVETLCSSRNGWATINRAISNALEGVTLADLNAPMQFPPLSRPAPIMGKTTENVA